MIIRLIPHVHPRVPDGQCKRCAYMCWWLHIVRVVWAGFPVWLEAIWYHIKGGLQTPRMTYICPNHIARWHQSRVFILTSLLQGKGLISQTSCPVLDEMRLHNMYVCSTPNPTHTPNHLPRTNHDPNPHSPPPLSCPFLGCFCYSAPFRNLSSVAEQDILVWQYACSQPPISTREHCRLFQFRKLCWTHCYDIIQKLAAGFDILHIHLFHPPYSPIYWYVRIYSWN